MKRKSQILSLTPARTSPGEPDYVHAPPSHINNLGHLKWSDFFVASEIKAKVTDAHDLFSVLINKLLLRTWLGDDILDLRYPLGKGLD